MNANRSAAIAALLLATALVGPGRAVAQSPLSTCAEAADGTPCDDGKGCTLEDTCRRGACVGTPVDALCGVGLEPLACYRVGPAGSSYPAFTPRTEAVLDEFRLDRPSDPERLDLRKAERVCSAALPDAAGRLHHEAYRARAASPAGNRTLEIETGIGTIGLRIARPSRLLVPSGVALGEGGAPAPAGSPRRFTCYQTASTTPFAPRTVTLTDLRGGPWTYEVSKPTSLCVPEFTPATAPNARPQAHAGYLACLKAKPARTNPSAARTVGGFVSTTNRYGAEVLRLRRVREICVPAVPALQRSTPPPFAFLTEPGEVNAAMKTIFDQAATAPRTPEAASAVRQARDAASAVIRRNPSQAQVMLLAALEGLAPDDVGGHTSLMPLVWIAGDSAAVLDHLTALLLAPPSATEPPAHEVDPPDGIVRHLVLAALRHLVQQGSQPAKQRILAAVQAPDPGVQAFAIGHHYALSRSRRRAQREMRSLLPLERRHLLYSE